MKRQKELLTEPSMAHCSRLSEPKMTSFRSCCMLLKWWFVKKPKDPMLKLMTWSSHTHVL